MSRNWGFRREYGSHSKGNRNVVVEIENQQFFFLIKFNVCSNDENS